MNIEKWELEMNVMNSECIAGGSNCVNIIWGTFINLGNDVGLSYSPGAE